jgi:hypothetical protein
MVVIIGDHWLNATFSNGRQGRRIDDPYDMVRCEVETALELRMRILPVLVGNEKMPARDTLPASISDLAECNAATLSAGPDFHERLRRLLEEIERLVGRPSFGMLLARRFGTLFLWIASIWLV